MPYSWPNNHLLVHIQAHFCAHSTFYTKGSRVKCEMNIHILAVDNPFPILKYLGTGTFDEEGNTRWKFSVFSPDSTIMKY